MLPHHYCVTEAHGIPNEISKAIRIVVEGQPVIVSVTGIQPLIKSPFTLYQTNDNIHILKSNPTLPSILNLSSSNSGYLDKGRFLKTGL